MSLKRTKVYNLSKKRAINNSKLIKNQRFLIGMKYAYIKKRDNFMTGTEGSHEGMFQEVWGHTFMVINL